VNTVWQNSLKGSPLLQQFIPEIINFSTENAAPTPTRKKPTIIVNVDTPWCVSVDNISYSWQELAINSNNSPEIKDLRWKLFHLMNQEKPLPKYSINFVWVSRGEVSSLYDQIKKKETLNRLKQWQVLNSKAQLTIWHDYDDDAYIEKVNDALIVENLNVNLKKLTDIPMVNNNDLLNVDIPIYFRADLLRQVVALYAYDHFNTKDGSKYFVYSDFNVPGNEGSYLFSHRSIDLLDKFGLMLSDWSGLSYLPNIYVDRVMYENSFFILDLTNKNANEANRIMVLANIYRVKNYLKVKSELTPKFTATFAPSIYGTYSGLICLLYALNGEIVLKSKKDGTKMDLNHKEPDYYFDTEINPSAPEGYGAGKGLEKFSANPPKCEIPKINVGKPPSKHK
jgi:hypothetical protein